MNVTFLQPWALLLLLLLPLFVLLGRRRMVRFSTGSRRVALGARVALAALFVLTLAQPLLGRTSDVVSVVLAVDRSDSVGPEARAAADAFVAAALRQVDDRHRLGIVAFGRDAAVERPVGGPGVASQPAAVAGDGSDVAGAIHLARSLLPSVGGRRIVVLSDGRETIGRAEDEARAAAQEGVQLSVVPLATAPPPEAYVEALDVPPQLREGEPLDAVVSVGSTVEQDATVELWLDQRLISQQSVHLAAGSNRFTASQAALKQGFHSFWARVAAPGDAVGQNDELAAFTVVKERARVLMIAPNEARAKPLQESLTAAQVQVDLRPPSAIPPQLSAMKRYDAVVLIDTPASALALDQMKTIQAYVQTLGGGLVVVGGENSYALGNYADTPLAEALPVAMNVPGKRDRGSVSLMLVVDKSGSMDMSGEGVTKMEMARTAASLAVDALDPTDRIGVLAFDSDGRWVVPPQAVGQGGQVEQIKQRIGTIEASGGTEIYPALEMSYQAIRAQPTRYKHILLLTDGRSLSSSDYDQLVAQMQQSGVTLSTIAIGADADTDLLQRLAKLGEGRYYYVDKARDIPTVTTAEAKIASGSAVVQGQIQPTMLAPSPILRGIAPVSLPGIGGYQVTSIKERAQTVLAPNDGRADPILAGWQYGLGRSVAWTSDLGPTWATPWLGWSEFQRFWAQAVRWAMPAPGDPNLQTTVAVEPPNVTVRVDAVDDDGVFRDQQDLRVSIAGQSSVVSDQPMRQVAPGRYELTAAVAAEGPYAVDVTQVEGGQPTRTESTGFVVPYPAEYRAFGVDQTSLDRLAAAAGGKILRDPRAVFLPDGLTFEGQERRPLWRWLLAAAMALLPIDIALRRLRLPYGRVAGGVAGAAGRLFLYFRK